MRSRGVRLVGALVFVLTAGVSASAAGRDVEGDLEVASFWPDGRLADTLGSFDLSGNGRFVLFESQGRTYRRDLRDDVTEQLALPRDHMPRAPVITSGGRFVAYLNTDVVGRQGHSRLVADIYVHDVRRDVTRRVLRVSDRVGGAHLSEGPVLGGGLRYVAFASRDPDFALHDTNARRDVFVLDRRSGHVDLVSATPRGRPGNGLSCCMDMTADGRTVVFTSVASNLVRGDTNDTADVFLRDLDAGTTTRLNVTADGGQSRGAAWWPTVSADGSTAAFIARPHSLGLSSTDNEWEALVRDLVAGTTTPVAPDPLAGGSYRPTLSEDGRYVAYDSSRPDITSTPGCTDSHSHVYLHDRLEQTTTCLSPNLDPQILTDGVDAHISADGAVVAFYSELELLPSLEFAERFYAWRRTPPFPLTPSRTYP